MRSARGYFVARPCQSPRTSRPAAICARWIPRRSNSSTTHSSTERISPVILDSSQQHWAPSRLRRNPHSAPSARQHEVPLGSFDHPVANVATADAAGAWHSGEPQNATVQSERDAHPLAVVAADLELSEHQRQSIPGSAGNQTHRRDDKVDHRANGPKGKHRAKRGMQRATAWGRLRPYAASSATGCRAPIPAICQTRNRTTRSDTQVAFVAANRIVEL